MQNLLNKYRNKLDIVVDEQANASRVTERLMAQKQIDILKDILKDLESVNIEHKAIELSIRRELDQLKSELRDYELIPVIKLASSNFCMNRWNYLQAEIPRLEEELEDHVKKTKAS